MAARHASHDEACAVCQENSRERAMTHGVLFENELWLVRHSEPPYGTVGWLTLQAKRHVPGPGYFSDAEAANVGIALRHLSKVLQEAAGPSCLRVYIAAMGESYPHFHCHLVPRYADGPKGWPVFGQIAEAAAAQADGKVLVEPARVEALVAAVKAALEASPLPAPTA